MRRMLLLMAALVAGSLASAPAQTDFSCTAVVDFPFMVGRQTMAPGTYRFSLSENLDQVQIVDVKNGQMKVFPVIHQQEHHVLEDGRLVFNRQAELRQLNQIHFPGTTMFTEILGSGISKPVPPQSSISVAAR
jgi:hypothetical protein